MESSLGDHSIGRSQLLAALTGAGFEPARLAAPGMGELFVLPHAGRVIGLFAGGRDENLLWINQALGQAESAREALTSDQWVHLGGDRTWLSPEYELHVGDLARAWETYRVPAAVDPGHYTLDQSPQQISLRSRAQVVFNRQRVTSSVEIEKSVRLLADPLRLEAGFQSIDGIEYAGYELSTTLRLVDPPAGGPAISLWNILVVSASGWAMIPAWAKTSPRDYFVPTPPARVLAGRQSICYRLDGREQHKVGFRAAALTGRAGYLRDPQAGRSTLLVRSFAVNPSGAYIDSPWDAPDELGYAFQLYNDGGELGAFGELEYHTPAIGGDSGLDRHADVSQLWAYTGPAAAIRRIAERFLGEESLRLLPSS